MDIIFPMLFSRTLGGRLVSGTGGFFDLGRVIMVPSPSVSIGTWCSNDELMAGGQETIFFECLKSSLLMPSG